LNAVFKMQERFRASRGRLAHADAQEKRELLRHEISGKSRADATRRAAFRLP
jgi:hypothetical protein